MFLNTTYRDFKHYLEVDDRRKDSILGKAPSYVPSWPSPALTTFDTPAILDGSQWDSEDLLLDFDDADLDVNMFENDNVVEMSSLMPTYHVQMVTPNDPTFCWTIARNPSPFALGDNEMYLLDYFTHGVSPRCTTWPADNPFARTILPVCMSAQDKPLFNIVMAVASHQLSLLNDGRFKKDIWVYRGKALRSFQGEMSRLQSQQGSLVDWEQIISTLVMLAFFDVSSAENSRSQHHLTQDAFQDLPR